MSAAIVRTSHEEVGGGRGDRREPAVRGGHRTEDYGHVAHEFTGDVDWVQIDVGEDAEDVVHFISAEERLRIAMARQ